MQKVMRDVIFGRYWLRWLTPLDVAEGPKFLGLATLGLRHAVSSVWWAR